MGHRPRRGDAKSRHKPGDHPQEARGAPEDLSAYDPNDTALSLARQANLLPERSHAR